MTGLAAIEARCFRYLAYGDICWAPIQSVTRRPLLALKGLEMQPVA